jgi:putative transposase
MPQSLARVLVHLVFSTKNREPFITQDHPERMFEYLGGTLNAIDCPVVIVGGMPDHVHLLFVQARTLSLSKVIEELKKESSKWAKETVHPDFYWQNGYGAFSVSPSAVPQVTRYIANQEKNHRVRTFQDEFLELLHANGMEWDDRYVWE